MSSCPRARPSWSPLVAVAVVLLLFVGLRSCPAPQGQQGLAVKVVAVVDGDSITALHDHRQFRVRLEGIDCPESGQPFGTQARQFTARLAHGKVVTLKISGTDSYDRTLAYVVLPAGNCLQHELLKSGLAWHYKEYNADPDLARLEQDAKSRKLGLWSDPNPVPPWEWRRRTNEWERVAQGGAD